MLGGELSYGELWGGGNEGCDIIMGWPGSSIAWVWTGDLNWEYPAIWPIAIFSGHDKFCKPRKNKILP